MQGLLLVIFSNYSKILTKMQGLPPVILYEFSVPLPCDFIQLQPNFYQNWRFTPWWFYQISAKFWPKCKAYSLWFFPITAKFWPKCKAYPLWFYTIFDFSKILTKIPMYMVLQQNLIVSSLVVSNPTGVHGFSANLSRSCLHHADFTFQSHILSNMHWMNLTKQFSCS